MRDFNGRRTFTASILVDPIQAEFKNDGLKLKIRIKTQSHW